MLNRHHDDHSPTAVTDRTGVCLAPADFRRVLGRERMRSDRSHVAFALLIIAPRANRVATFQKLERSLAGRLRGTDVVGYLNDEQLAVLLTDTDHEGAQTLAETITVDCDPPENLELTIHLYPSLPDQLVTRATEDAARRTDLPHDHMGPDDSNDDAQGPKLAQPFFTHTLPLWKRTIDIVASSLGLMVLAPLFALVAIGIKLTSAGPVFFRQLRSGQGGKPFVIFKFRTMCADAEARKVEVLDQNEQDGPAFKLAKDPRITTIGTYLRRTCLDELPQLWNVLRGDMTLVGPRPLPCDEAMHCDIWQQRRLDLVPGLTCFWQVDGSRDDFAEWMRMDIRYGRRTRFWVDIKLLWRTLLKVVLHRASC